MTDTSEETSSRTQPFDSLKNTAGGYIRALGGNVVNKLTDRVGGFSDRLTQYAQGGGSSDDDERDDDGGGGGGGTSFKDTVAGTAAEKMAEGESPVKAGLSAVGTGIKEKVKGVFGGGGGKGGGSKKFKFMNFVETIDVGVPLTVAYNAWTSYDQWPDIMKKAENADLDDEEAKVSLKGQVFWSHRQWDAKIIDQVPDEYIHWRSSGPKGHFDGTVSFHPLGERLTRLIIIVEYHPQGFFEKTGNLWRAVNRRMRLEMKFWVRWVMTDVLLDPDKVQGYRAEIHDEEVVRTHDEVLEDEQAEEGGYEGYEDGEYAEGDGEYAEEPEEEPAEEAPEDEYEPAEEADYADEEEYEEEPEGGDVDEGEAEDYAEEEPEGEYAQDEEETTAR